MIAELAEEKKSDEGFMRVGRLFISSKKFFMKMKKVRDLINRPLKFRSSRFFYFLNCWIIGSPFGPLNYPIGPLKFFFSNDYVSH